MSRQDMLIFALSVIKNECYRHYACYTCPFYNEEATISCGIKRKNPEDWQIPDGGDEKVEPIDI